jgi:hypothetical protein
MAFNGGNLVADRLTNLPAHLPSLIGREEAIAQVRERLLEAERGLLTLTGTGCSGKTSLALAVGREVLDSMEFADGVCGWWNGLRWATPCLCPAPLPPVSA